MVSDLADDGTRSYDGVSTAQREFYCADKRKFDLKDHNVSQNRNLAEYAMRFARWQKKTEFFLKHLLLVFATGENIYQILSNILCQCVQEDLRVR